MSEFLNKTVTRTKTLNPGETLEVSFNVPNPGNVVASGYARWDFPFDPVKRQVELQTNDVPPKTIKKLDAGTAMVTFLGTPAKLSNLGTWKARVINKEDTREPFRLKVSYPGTVEVKTLPLPLSLINAFIDDTVKKISIHLTSGNNASYIKFPSSMGVPNSTFTLPNFTKKILLTTIKERINDINSNSVSARLDNANSDFINGSVKFEVSFETSGREIKGTVDGHIKNMKLTVRLGLSVQNSQITYQVNNIGVDFPISIDLVNVPGFLEDLLNSITGFRNAIKSKVKDTVRNVFASSGTRQAITNALNSKIKAFLGNDTRIVSAKVQNGNLVIKYYKA